MLYSRRQALHLAAGAAVLPVSTARAQQSSRPISIVVPFAAGGGTDVLGRAIAELLQQRLGQTVIIDNKAGASGNLGAQAVMRAAPDGHTLLLTVDPPFTANMALMKSVPYDPIRSFAPIVEIAIGTSALTVHTSMPVTSTKEFVDYVRARPGAINYGSSGVGTSHHLTMEYFKVAARLNLLHVPFRDAAGAAQNLLGGHVVTIFLPLNVALPLPKDKVRVLAVSSRERVAGAPDLPTLIEQGYADFVSDVRFGLLGPAGLPSDIVGRYNVALNEILRAPSIVAKLAALGIAPSGGTAAQYASALAADLAQWQRVVKDAGITAD